MINKGCSLISDPGFGLVIICFKDCVKQNFGVTSSPFLLNGTVRKHTSNYNFDSDFVTKIVDSFFVADFTGGEKAR